jgi:phage gp45-like
MSDRNMRWGVVKKASADKGPHKLVEVEADGKIIDCVVGETFGVQSSPHVGAWVLLGLADGDEGKAVIITSMPRPGDRVDGQKEGEVTIKNHETGNAIQHDANGNTKMNTKADLDQTVGGNVKTDAEGNVVFKSGGVIHLNPP